MTPRLLPASDLGERGVICSFLLAPREVGNLCAVRRLESRHFHNPAFGTIFGYLMARWGEGKPVDVVTLTQGLADAKLLEQVGGAALISELYTLMPTATNVGYYIELLEDKFLLREVIRVAMEFATRGYDEQDDPHGLLAEFMGSVTNLSGLTNQIGYVPMRERVKDKVDRMEGQETADSYILTGLSKLDHHSPLRRTDMALITGERKAGKSFLACSIARHILRNGGACFYATLEQSSQQEVDRLLHGYVRVPIARDHVSKLSEHESIQFMKITDAANWRLDLRDDIYDLHGLVAAIRQAKARWPDLHLCVVDYAQLVQGIRLKGDSRETEVASISRLLKRTFKEVECAGLLLSQLNKEGDSRESMALEQDMTARWNLAKLHPPKNIVRQGAAEVEKFDTENKIKRMLSIPHQRNGDSGIGFVVAATLAIGVVSDLVNEPIQTDLPNDDQWR